MTATLSTIAIAFPVVDWPMVAEHLMQLAVAYVLAIPVGLHQERSGTGPGLRTFPVVAVACCAFVLIGRSAFGDNPDALSRVLYGLMTGMGFIGGGAILKQKDGVVGTAAAASLWATGAMGAAVGFVRYEIAIALAVMTLANLLLMKPVKEQLGTDDEPLK